MEWLAFERFAATWKDYEAAYGYQEMFYWKMGRAGLCFVIDQLWPEENTDSSSTEEASSSPSD